MAEKRYRVTPGTHSDVWVFPDLSAIAIHYPDPPVDLEREAYDASTFYLEYKKAISFALNGMLFKTGSMGADNPRFAGQWGGSYNEYKFKHGKEVVSEMISYNSFDPSKYPASDKWFHIWKAWNYYLGSTSLKPEFCVLGDFYAFFTRNRPVQIGDRSYTMMGRLPVHSWAVPKWFYRDAKKLDFVEYMNIVHPLGHFPPGLDSLRNSVFFDPRDPYLSRERFQAYGDWADTIYNKCSQLRRRVMYSELVKPFGEYGIKIDLRSIEMNTYFEIDLDRIRYLYTEDQLKEHSFKLKGSEYATEYMHFETRPDSPNAMGSFFARDSWIQCWIKGGPIPLSFDNIAEIVGTGRYALLKPCQYLNDLYEIAIVKKFEHRGVGDFFAPFMEIGMAVGSIALNVAFTGVYGTFVMLATQVGKNLMGILTAEIAKAFPDVGLYVTMGVNILFSTAMKKFRQAGDTKSVQMDKMEKLIKGLADIGLKQVIAPGKVDMFTNGLVNHLDEQIDEETMEVLDAIGEQFTQIGEFLVRSDSAMTQMRKMGRPDLEAVAVTRVAKEGIKQRSSFNTALAIVGGALLIKYLKGK